MSKKKDPPTPYEFEQKIGSIMQLYWIDRRDIETCHVELDEYICQVMESLGYSDGIRLFRKIPKWYA